MSNTPEHTGRRARRRMTCVIVGHRWTREQRPDHTVLLTCRRCGHVDAVERDLDFGAMGGGMGNYPGGFGG